MSEENTKTEDRAVIILSLHGPVWITSLIITLIWKCWYETYDVHQVELILASGSVIFTMMYIRLITLILDKRLMYHVYLLGMFIITVTPIHIIGWGILHMFGSGIHPFRVVCYMMGIIMIGLIGVINMIRVLIIRQRNQGYSRGRHEYPL